MKKNILFLVFFVIVNLAASAQYVPVTFDYEKSYFNESLPLPAEKNFIIKSNISPAIEIVKVTIYKNDSRKHAAHSAIWRRSFNNQTQNFDLPINYKLRGNSEYDFLLDYYRRVTDGEKDVLRNTLYSTLDNYISSQMEIGRNKIETEKPVSIIISDMNDIVTVGMLKYNNLVGYNFDGFSDIIKDKIKQIEDARLGTGKFAILKKDEGIETNKESKTVYAQNLINELKEMVHGELGQLINTDLVVVADTKEIKEYPTEKTMNTLPINVGYGAVYFNGKWNNLNYGAAPYVGLSLPLGNVTFSPIMANTSISAGIFLQDLEDKDGNTKTGPFIKKPIYVALGYKFFRFIRFNVGATVLENRVITIQNANTITKKDISIRPMVGLSAEINIWAGIKD